MPASRRPRLIAVCTTAACGAMLALFAGLAWSAVQGKSATQDESYHALAGWLHLWKHDDRFDSEDPPLWNSWAALANGPAALRVYPDKYDWSKLPLDTGSELVFVVDALYRTPGNDATAFIRRARGLMLLVGAALGAAIAVVAWRCARAGGARTSAAAAAALTSCALFSLDPNFLAHAPLVKNDVAASAAMLAVVAAVWAAGRRLSAPRLGWLALASSFALAVKFSGIGIVGIGLILLMVRAVLPFPWPVMGRSLVRPGQRLIAAALAAALVIAVGLGAIWLIYGLRFRPAPLVDSTMNLQPLLQRMVERRWQEQLGSTAATPPAPRPEDVAGISPPLSSRMIAWAASHRLVPQAFAAGLLFTQQSAMVRPGFLCGRFSLTGWWWYFPFAMLAKTPVATLMAFALTGMMGIFGKREARALSPSPGTPGEGWGEGDFEGRDANATLNVQRSTLNARQNLPPVWTTLCLAIPIVTYLAVAMASNLNLGLRHVLPIYPLLFIATGLAAARLWMQRRRLAIGVGLLIGIGLASETIAAYPNYIPFFNVIAGGSRGGLRLLSDSNLDWGQDLPLLAQWQREHPRVKLYLAYFGTADPAYFGIRYTNLPAGYQLGPPVGQIDSPGVIAISATLLQGAYDRGRDGRSLYGWLLDREQPAAILGGSIYLFDYPFDAPTAAR